MFDKSIAEIIAQSYKTEKYPPLVCELPSRGIIYPKNSFFAKYGKVALKKLTGRNEDWSSEPAFASRFMLNTLFESQLLFNEEPYEHVPIDSFLIADRNIITLTQRIVSYGKQLIGLQLTCSNCDNDLEKDVLEIENYEIEHLDPEACRQLKANSNEFFYRSPDRQWTIAFRLLTIADERTLIETAHPDYEGSYSSMAALRKTIVALNGETDQEKIWQSIIDDTFPAKECIRFQNYVRKFTPYVRIISEEVSCKQCGQKNQIRADVDLNLLALNNTMVRDVLTEEMFWLHRQLRISHSDLYNMPLDFRKRLFKRELKRLDDEKKERDSKTSNNAAPPPFVGH